MAENQYLWPFENLKTNELVQELMARKIKIEKPTKKDMEIKLRKAMGAHIRTPTLSFKNESKPITNLNLKNYEDGERWKNSEDGNVSIRRKKSL